MFDLNATSVVNTARAVVPAMIAAGAGNIVNVAAAASVRGQANMAAYAVAKNAVVRLTEAWRPSCAATGSPSAASCRRSSTRRRTGRAMPERRYLAMDARRRQSPRSCSFGVRRGDDRERLRNRVVGGRARITAWLEPLAQTRASHCSAQFDVGTAL